MGDPNVGVGGLDEPTEVIEIFGDGFGQPAGEPAVELGVDGDNLTA